ncbi:VOC family protein (plasmid) [Actinacidiphila glaucinigra]|uniref:VOC family protein n=1 Tax=Actinacidiphila glaucinigra TaxID=235986 RepID=UPI002DD8256E|nr:VOC family protein [Actinacidiphila glaucinigra]WSD65785.1 VOC family protein [Actinacidiphila glaucinigra]
MAVQLHAITFDCVDPQALARFWAAALGQDVDPSDYPGIVTIGMGQGNPFYVFQKLDALPSGRNRAHPDFSTDDYERDCARLVGLGASVVAEVKENGIRFTTFTDPEGNKFDLTDE